MVEACERRILEFPLGMDAREVAKELKREGWYAWASDYESIVFRIKQVRTKAETEERVWLIPIALSGRRRSYYQKTRVIHSPFPSARLSRVSHADCSVLSPAELPIALRGASPEVVEDSLCVCKDDLAKL